MICRNIAYVYLAIFLTVDKNGSSDISSDSFLKRKTAEQIVYLNCDQQMYSYEQQFLYHAWGLFIPTNALVKNTKW